MDYVGDNPQPEDAFSAGYRQLSWADVIETYAIEGFNWALMAADLDLGRKLAHCFQDPGDGDLMNADINRYTHGLKHALLDEPEKGAALLQQTIDEYTRSVIDLGVSACRCALGLVFPIDKLSFLN